MSEELGDDAHDQLARIARGLTSMVPLVGGVLGEVIGTVIPNQRVDRIVRYLRELEKRLGELEGERQRLILADKERIDLIEEGGEQAARATNDERVVRIAAAVYAGLGREEAGVIRRKRILTLLGQIDDDEISILNAYGQSMGGDWSAWDKVDRPDPATLDSSADEVDEDKLYDAGVANLLRLGLLTKQYKTVRRGEQVQFDPRKGDFPHSKMISYLGRMLLRDIGLPAPFDRDEEEEG